MPTNHALISFSGMIMGASGSEGFGSIYPTPIAARFPALDSFPKRRKRMKTNEAPINQMPSIYWGEELEERLLKRSSGTLDYSDPYYMPNLWESFECGKYGSLTKEIEELMAQSRRCIDSCYARDPTLPHKFLELEKNHTTEYKGDQSATIVIDLEDEDVARNVPVAHFVPPAQLVPSAGPLVILDSDDEDDKKPNCTFQGILSINTVEGSYLKEHLDSPGTKTPRGSANLAFETEKIKDKGVYVGVEDDSETEDGNDANFDGLDDIWNEMSFAIECSKDVTADAPSNKDKSEDEDEECEHSYILKDDIGYVCRICGIIKKSIESIIDYPYSKSAKNARTYRYEGRTTKDSGPSDTFFEPNKSSHEFEIAEVSAHPRHKKQMKPHQVEGFNFLLNNLVTDNPGGCIMAHAPGSGKTFMIISFLQSFMAKYPFARPLVVLPRGILATWKKEFLRWQVEDFPLYDFYSVKADNRGQQLEVLKQWAGERSILFLGYKQFSVIVCDNEASRAAVACQEILLTVPSILILDEGHTPRNQDTDVLTSLEKVQTPRKVVLSGTLYQNHVKEVFNILNLVRPKFLKLEDSKAIKRRILSRAVISSNRNLIKKGSDNEFFELVEHTLLKDENVTRKATVIQDLREMTRKVLHYYKGDFLEELPGLVDFTVILKLHPKQKSEVAGLKNLRRKFKISAEGSALYVHPQLKSLSKHSVKERIDEEKIDMIVDNLEVREGVKAKFFLNLLALCESHKEKLLVFSQYLLPLKFLERLTIKFKGYCTGKEIFMITGDSDNEVREASMERFNTSADARVFFGSIKACGEGISLVGASRIIILDVHLNPSVTRQAIGRAFRPGQEKKVYTYRLVASSTPEEEDHTTCFRKESISKMWFEWNQYYGLDDYEMEKMDPKQCGDEFLETARFSDDIVGLYKR
ncbi:PREDICTED: protein CHROMATIN REMODELING 35-like isoform X2 [Ipomoea nil]|uniref:protein CHROMATIN REMODELING 35-like isoform X2 n=1 Tax=Ipomoea nil TaxID=35883 RepID=UPI000901A4D0|nr:PREDICTED: protein CHROMATIN REMODELING 35-like isoform X2 [Ipomoea nil]